MLISGKPETLVGSGNMLQLHAVCSESTAGDIASALDGVELVSLQTTVGEVALAHEAFAGETRPSIMLVELDPEQPNELAELASIVEAGRAADIPVIATSVASSIQTVRQLLHLGVADFVPQPITRTELLTAIEAGLGRKNLASSSSHVPARSGRIVSVMTSSGGAGATTTAVYLAHELQQSSSKTPRKVCIVDLDVQFGSVALHLDLEPKRTIRDLARDSDKIDQSLFSAVETRHDTGLGVIAAPRELVMLDAFAPRTISRILEVAAQSHDYVVVDLPGYWTNWTANVLGASHLVLLVVQMTVPAIRSARRRLDFIRADGMSAAPVSVIANRHDKSRFRGPKSLDVGEVEKVLRHRVDFSLPSDFNTINEAQNRGVPLSEVKSSAPIVKQFKKLAAFVAEQCEVQQPAAAADQKRHSRTEV